MDFAGLWSGFLHLAFAIMVWTVALALIGIFLKLSYIPLKFGWDLIPWGG